MPRVKRGTTHVKRRRNLLSKVKGFKWGRKSKIRQAKPAALKAGVYAFRDRRVKKRTFRQLWSIKINAGARANGTTYSKLISGLKKVGIDLDRKVLAEIAEKNPGVFTKIVEKTK
ncbi:50S ribosomal protein L20 [Candidatus Uhrbacteria bacterium CG_4_9_14_0_2_um_filter_41_50]|uniref:Large ribosomal subunit protein bL20 n=1 Tax=Candidatus Uhrbacteria bacterium CG_4_9_14_0_2_um_filter_41_50 TaxID=1975031 RepID=A0A2M8EPR2_9BACT|nr:MAG: 50S ribosomal protein L20 [Candidatus Uhrbacteria bacterium CG_4_10_14_3_um_filter_41_21]PIZ55301.1 MAG: 50S ribosomal protein L20 [Candidatus Uhrbacteria bacterium CG_4_10_14_0_2_um_filter_41_21]PJB84540.1 MAG: 50S ribosomal protein L20 [Candidatus Uhrbacteria bacterium CG_4_9_14_0_8_um_filter_41_16]PJC24730.1 MAG: 50S ribosomal protein L20 [Candidatus Uhrbacteria bacterium CG_4_9_14_0_2_um_filter_41_50]PJE74905.1 MAG: 50S ribosomal protein L20 [Candidatus Uhrbacteria bacterium CG10_bi